MDLLSEVVEILFPGGVTLPALDGSLLASRWSDLDPRGRHSFRFVRGETPLSTLGAVVAGWFLFHLCVWATFLAMRRRGRGFRLRWVTAVHNGLLCLFSLAVLVGCAYDTFACVAARGWRGCMCAVREEETGGALYYWGYIFYLSKYWEFADTVLLALKKKPLTLLHVYHHTIVVLMMWSFFPHGLSLVSWGVLANSFVHVWMYLYFALASLGVSGLGTFRRAMTTMQIVQFVWSFIGSAPFILFALGGGGNDSPVISGGLRCMGAPAFYFGSVINVTFLALFVDFYRRSYAARRDAKKAAGGGNGGERKRKAD